MDDLDDPGAFANEADGIVAAATRETLREYLKRAIALIHAMDARADSEWLDQQRFEE